MRTEILSWSVKVKEKAWDLPREILVPGSDFQREWCTEICVSGKMNINKYHHRHLLSFLDLWREKLPHGHVDGFCLCLLQRTQRPIKAQVVGGRV